MAKIDVEGLDDNIEIRTDGDEGEDEGVEYIDEEMVVEMVDEDGNSQDFQLVYVTTIEERQFAVLFPVEDEEEEEDDEATEAVIMEMVDDETFQSVDDDELLEKVFDQFRRDNSERFDFVDE